MKPTSILFCILAMLFMPSCDHEKNEPMSFDCVDKAREYVEEIQGYEIEPLDEKDNWNESEEQKDKVEKVFKERSYKKA